MRIHLSSLGRRPAVILAIASITLAGAARAQAPQVAAENAWSRATPAGAMTGAVYVTLTSRGGDTLTGVSSPAAQSAEVHEMSMEGTVMRMRQLAAGLPLAPGERVTLRPGGYHIMLMGLKAPLQQGQTVMVRLSFAKSPPVDVAAVVGGIGAAGPRVP